MLRGLLRGGCGTTSGRETHEDLEVVIDHPLQTGKGTNHDNSHWQTVPETLESNVLVDSRSDSTHSLAGLAVGVELADHDIGGVRHNSAEDTGSITSNEGDSGLGSLAVVALATGQTVVNHLNNGLERSELHHGVRDLATPERIETLVETAPAFLGRDLAEAIKGALVLRRNGTLHADLDGLEGAERNIGQEFCRGGRAQVQCCLVLVRVFGTSEVRILFLEKLIPAILERTLGRVTKEGRTPTGKDAANTFVSKNVTPSLEVALVQLRVDLASRLDKIQRCYGSVSDALQNQLVPPFSCTRGNITVL